MAIEIIRSDEPIHVEQIVMTIYGAPGLGKTTLAFMADKPLLLDFDKGAQRAKNRKDSVRASSWSDVENMDEDDVAGFKTIVVDTVGRALDSLALDIMQKDDKMGRNGALTLPGWGVLKGRFAGWITKLRSYGVDVVLVAHATEEKNGDQMVERLDMQGASKNEIYKVSDAMGRIAVANRKRVLDFTPGEVSFGKDPAQLGRVNVPDVEKEPQFLGELIDSIKGAMNELSQEQKKRMDEIESWRVKIDKLADDKAVNDFVKKQIPKVPEDYTRVVKGMLHGHAKDRLGLVPDRDAGGYRPKEDPKPEPEPAGPDEGDAVAAKVR